MSQSWALNVVCPTCGAKRGARCRTKHIHGFVSRMTHEEREEVGEKVWARYTNHKAAGGGDDA